MGRKNNIRKRNKQLNVIKHVETERVNKTLTLIESLKLQEASELEKIIHEFNIKYDMSRNPNYRCVFRSIKGRRAFERCYQYDKNTRYMLKLSCKPSDEKYITKLIDSGITVSLYGKFTYKFVEKVVQILKQNGPCSSYEIHIVDMGDLDYKEYDYADHIDFTSCKIQPRQIETLFEQFKDRNTNYIIGELVKNDNVDPEIVAEIAKVDILSYLFHGLIYNKKFNVVKYADKIINLYNKQFKYISILLESPNVTEAIFLDCMYQASPEEINKLNIKPHLYKNLSLDVILRYFRNIDPVLLYKYKKYKIYSKKVNSKYGVWYRYPQFRDEFVKKSDWHIRHISYYASYVIKNIQFTKEDSWYFYNNHTRVFIKNAYKNKHLTSSIVKQLFDDGPGISRWYKNYNIPINEVVELVKNDRSQIPYNRKDIPISVLLELTNNSPDYRICSNIYLTREIMLKYSIKPCNKLLTRNLFSLDPLYIKQPSYTISL